MFVENQEDALLAHPSDFIAPRLYRKLSGQTRVMVTSEDIKADVPDWPDEVIEQRLLKLADRGRDTGWPPPG
jgi:hypothetical protein